MFDQQQRVCAVGPNHLFTPRSLPAFLNDFTFWGLVYVLRVEALLGVPGFIQRMPPKFGSERWDERFGGGGRGAGANCNGCWTRNAIL